ncbi:MAG: PAS domain S-box protein [Promethearchaeota archaeon]
MELYEYNIFSDSESKMVKSLLKNPKNDYQKLISLFEKKINKIKKSEEKYRSLIEGLNFLGIGIDIVSIDHKIVQQNKILKERFDSFPGDLCYEKYMGNKKGCIVCPMRGDIKNNIIERTEFIGTDGKQYKLISTPYPNPDGTIDKCIEIIIDITEDREFEQKLKESEMKYRNLFDNFPIGIFLFDYKGNLIEGNTKSYNSFSGTPVDLSIGKNFREITNLFKNSEELLRIFIKRELERAKGKELKPIELRLVRQDGKERWIHWHSTTLQVEDKTLIQALVQDITQRKLFEQKLRESEDKFRKIAEESLLAICIIQDDVIKYANQTMATLYGYSLEEIKNWKPGDFSKVVGSDSFETVMEQIKKKQLGLSDVITRYTIQGIKKSGEKFWVDNISKSIIYKGRPADLITQIDVTERINAEKKLIELNKLKSEMLTRISHELKTPLMSIKGYTELLLLNHKDEFSEKVQWLIGEINNGSNRLETLIRDVLKTAELKSGSIQLKKSENSLSELIKKCVEKIQGFAKSRNHTFNLQIEDEIMTSFDKKQIEVVINNILTNAIKFTPPNALIEIKLKIKKDQVIISIKDSGIGFTGKEKERLFKQNGKIERYGQGFNVICEGSGLGLYISKKIIDLHGGDIWVESKGRNRGSTFYFSLPLLNE